MPIKIPKILPNALHSTPNNDPIGLPSPPRVMDLLDILLLPMLPNLSLKIHLVLLNVRHAKEAIMIFLVVTIVLIIPINLK